MIPFFNCPQVYADLGKRYFIDLVYEISDNTLEEKSIIPCDPKMNFTFDNCIYEEINKELMLKFNCNVPFLPPKYRHVSPHAQLTQH